MRSVMGYSDTHQPISTVSPSPTLHYSTMNVGNDGVGVRNTVLELRNPSMNTRNDCLGVCDITMNVGNDHIRVYSKFGLEVEG